MKLSTLKQTPFEIIAAIVTWLMVGSVSVYALVVNNKQPVVMIGFVVALFCLFIISFIYSTSGTLVKRMVIRKVHMLVQIVSVFTLYFILPINFTPILGTIWSAQLPQVTSFGRSVLISGLVCIPIFVIFQFYWEARSGIISAMVYWMFNVFAVVTMDRAFKEEQAKEQANQLNRELIATQSLLSEATKQSERLRISRNIHDVVGHHLTALTINLQVASHLTQGKAKAAVDQSYSVAKLLLGDVRSAVSEIRNMSVIDLRSALQRLFDHTPKLTVHFNFAESIEITEVGIAEVILRSVQEALTNALKHGGADQIWIDLSLQSNKAGQSLLLAIKDNGCASNILTSGNAAPMTVIPGNGLTGMIERVEELNGELSYVAQPPFFAITIRIPLLNDD
ncbi:MAG: histidine kinase [Psychrosphaera sp.]|nr:histidine kinase [Psychrosphaera sp.]